MGSLSHLPLRPYQDDAINASLRRGSILLALVQGSGKTRTAIETIKVLAEEGTVTSGAIFCPSSLKYQWRDSELAKWDDPELALVIDGDKRKRSAQYQRADQYRYTILNYDCLVHDWDLVQRFLPIDFIIADEVTYIKSFRAKRSKHMKALARGSKYRYGLSGQPVENRPEELFSIMEFVDPNVLGPFHRFDRTFIERDYFGRPQRYRNLGMMHERLGDAMFRRSRADIEQYLPKRVETDSPIHLTPSQAKIYEYIRTDLLALAEGMGSAGNFDLAEHYGAAQQSESSSSALKGKLMARITAMRLLCSHPLLLKASAEDFDSEDTTTGSAYASELVAAGVLDSLSDAQLNSSAKLDALMGQIDLAFDDSVHNKVVVFSVFKPMLYLISQELLSRKIAHVRMTGDTPAKQRQEAIDRFNEDPEVRVFLSSDAGAYGVNLDRGTHLICYDFPWSAGALSQRVARIDRTSTSHEHINIIYLYAKGTIEEYQSEMQRQKSRIAEAWVDGQNIDARGSLDLDLEGLVRFMAVPLNYV